MTKDKGKIKALLERLYKKYSSFDYYKKDPIVFPHRFDREEDIEIAGLIASAFAYGKVELFMKVLERIFQVLGNSPRNFVEDFDLKKDGKYFEGIKYRFNSPLDIVALIFVMSECIKKWGSLKKLFLHEFNKTKDIKSGLVGFVNVLKNFVNNEAFFHKKASGFDYLLISPEKGSACKRMNLFLRWMVRDKDKDIDFGIWKEVGKENLIMPLDTHVARISRCLGLLKRKSNDWQSAEELTRALKEFDPEDPVKYDFALCHIGVEGECSKRRCNECGILLKA